MNQKAEQPISQQVEAVHKNLAMQTIAKDTDSIFNALVVEPKRSVAVLPEEQFKNYFYPYFSGEAKLEDNPEVLPSWVSIAGSPMAEVNIIDNGGNVLFSVPPVFDSSIIENVKRNLGESFSDIYAQYKMHSNNLPIVGDKFLADALSNKLPKVLKASGNLTGNQQRWNEIFHRYGKESTASPVTVLPGNQMAGGDDVEYE